MFVNDPKAVYEMVEKLLLSKDPVFLARLGGSDTDLIVEYLSWRQAGLNRADMIGVLREGVKKIKRFNGYYDLDDDAEKVFIFCENMLEYYRRMKYAFLCNANFLSRYMPESLAFESRRDTSERGVGMDGLMAEIELHGEKCFFPYKFVERLTKEPLTLFGAFSSALADKRVLVLSPFSESIVENFANRATFFNDYKYPDFELVTVNTPITYDGLPTSMYPHADWFQTLNDLIDQVRRQSFDIALIGCGSYGLALGTMIVEEQRRSAVYVGGVLQLFFGIGGRRYMGLASERSLNYENFLRPREAKYYLPHVSIKDDSHTEGFGAYF